MGESGKPDTGSVTTKGQLVIPARIRRRLGIKTGTRVRFVEREGEIVLQPVTSAAIRGLCGILRSETLATAELLQERKRDREKEEQKVAKFRPR
jgi:AbrB family looped-hinge helix DNA binding protein